MPLQLYQRIWLFMMHIIAAYGTGATHNDQDGLSALKTVRDDSDDVKLVVMARQELDHGHNKHAKPWHPKGNNIHLLNLNSLTLLPN